MYVNDALIAFYLCQFRMYGYNLIISVYSLGAKTAIKKESLKSSVPFDCQFWNIFLQIYFLREQFLINTLGN